MPVGTVSAAGVGTAGQSNPLRLPATTAGAGSIAIAIVHADAQPTGSVGGWTFYGSAVQSNWLLVYWKQTVAGDGTYQWSGANINAAAINVFTEADTTAPIRVMGSAVNAFASGISVSVGGSAGDYLLFGAGIQSGVASTPPTGMTETFDLVDSFDAMTTAVESAGTLSANTSATRANTFAGANAVQGVLIAVQPAAAPAATGGYLTTMSGIWGV